ncbi:MAG TPA: Mur ligase family protein [Candidatus Paceibacterota bacterium]|nr:Mur ligase family protein [Candidatus Paceibacterota bacterium]
MSPTKKFFTNILRSALRGLARLTIWRYRPGVVGVTGSVGKTSTKLAIAMVLGTVRRVRVSSGNLNNDLGLPLVVLGDWSAHDLKLVSRDTPRGTRMGAKIGFWTKVVFVSLWHIAVTDKKYPEILVVEYGADRPGDIKYLLTIVRPNVSVITAIGDYPVHVEFYAGPEEVAREKGRLIECLPVGGFAVLNYDDETVMHLESRTRARVLTYGFEKGAEVQLARFENRVAHGAEGDVPAGIAFKVEHAGSSVPVAVEGAFGRAQAYAAGAATAVGLIFGMNLVKIAEALARYKPADARMQLLPGIKQTYVIDDSYNASPLSMDAALTTLSDLPAKRRIAVLGDMLEIGKYTPEAHERVGRLAAHAADMLFTVGPRAKFIADAARAAGMKKTSIFSYDTADEASRPLKDAMKKGDLVLVKGSHAMQLDRVVAEIKMIAPVMPSSSSPV